ncbi:hypothetical protein [Rhodococcus rhodochrous]|uniref:hypothetical protein n=1 Tax=Rhodococcus rhodochrous TaxID=1829 RepID=UPI001E47B3A7|nr:hypothetical protein [Rhodococcus rhodochrous]MCD2096547.1 hypothetical protein [Rhodococcus rhodochrous]MCD2121235.1 hypothetical protein [Rhodococcus rhodochrous]MCQ4137329.1 hypothetical protein [Rhodococcus rhodochrous]MDJ0021178.1 hypothetical protein [Rhodococcus rhodochrous]
MVGVSKLSHWIANLGKRDDKRINKRRAKAQRIHETNHGLRPADQAQPMTGNH